MSNGYGRFTLQGELCPPTQLSTRLLEIGSEFVLFGKTKMPAPGISFCSVKAAMHPSTRLAPFRKTRYNYRGWSSQPRHNWFCSEKRRWPPQEFRSVRQRPPCTLSIQLAPFRK